MVVESALLSIHTTHTPIHSIYLVVHSLGQSIHWWPCLSYFYWARADKCTMKAQTGGRGSCCGGGGGKWLPIYINQTRLYHPSTHPPLQPPYCSSPDTPLSIVALLLRRQGQPIRVSKCT